MIVERFKYSPSTDFSNIDAASTFSVIQELKPFLEGFKAFYNPYIVTIDIFRKFLTTGKLSPDIKNKLKAEDKELDRAFLDILRITDDLKSELKTDFIENSAKKNYFNHFHSHTVQSNQVEYLKLIHIYEILKFNTNEIKNKWIYIQNLFESIPNSSENNEPLEQILYSHIYPKLEYIERTYLYLRRLAYFLCIHKEKETVKNITVEGEYYDTIPYSVNLITDNSKDDIVLFLQERYLKKQEEISLKEKKKITIKNTEETEEKIKSSFTNIFTLDCRGNQEFNQHFLYLLKLDKEKLDDDIKKIHKSIFAETYMGAEHKIFKQELIKRMISKVSEENKILEYNIFLHDYFDTIASSILVHFTNESTTEKNITLFHFGPVYFLKFVLYCMKKARTGYVHSYMGKNQIRRELPFEYIKSKLMLWWDENVAKVTTTQDQNSRKLYNDIVIHIAKWWKKEQVTILTKIYKNVQLRKELLTHNLKALTPFLDFNLSHLFLLLFIRFLGVDFIYLPVHNKNFAIDGRKLNQENKKNDISTKK